MSQDQHREPSPDDDAEVPAEQLATVRSANAVRRVVALLTLVGGAVLLYASWQMPAGTLERPGAGLMPRLAAVGLIVAAVVALFERVHMAAEIDALPDRPGVRRQATVMVTLAAYAAVLPYLGFLLSTAVAMSVVARALNERGGIRRPVIIGVVVAALVDVSFRAFLSVSLPAGLLDIRLA